MCGPATSSKFTVMFRYILKLKLNTIFNVLTNLFIMYDQLKSNLSDNDLDFIA